MRSFLILLMYCVSSSKLQDLYFKQKKAVAKRRINAFSLKWGKVQFDHHVMLIKGQALRLRKCVRGPRV